MTKQLQLQLCQHEPVHVSYQLAIKSHPDHYYEFNTCKICGELMKRLVKVKIDPVDKWESY